MAVIRVEAGQDSDAGWIFTWLQRVYRCQPTPLIPEGMYFALVDKNNGFWEWWDR